MNKNIKMADVASELIENPVRVLNQEVENTMASVQTSNSTNLDQNQRKVTPTKSGSNESKNSSLEEDILGVNTLQMSDSDGDEIAPKVKSPPGTDILEETQRKEVNIDHIGAPIKDLEAMGQDKFAMESSHEDEQYGRELVKGHSQKKKKKKKRTAIFDSDSDENEVPDAPKLHSKPKTKFSALVDTDSESDTGEKTNETPVVPKRNSQFKLIDSDSDDEIEVKPKKEKEKKNLTRNHHLIKPGLIDSDSESEAGSVNSDNDNNDTIDQDEIQNLGSMEENYEGAKSKPIRESAKKAMDEMQAIQSEQQRLHREAHISVPYHKPKPHTLQEFLKRRTLMKPTVQSDGRRSLKMTPEELEEYAKLMDERAKEAKEFFKSESDSEEEELKDNTGCMDVDQIIFEEIENKQPNEDISPDVPDVASFENSKLDDVTVEPMDEGENNVNSEQIEPLGVDISSQPVVTEVLELPNLDLSTLHFNEKDENSQVSVHKKPPASIKALESHSDNLNMKRQPFGGDILTESPTLKGGTNMIIDLESGDMVEKKPSGADNLLQRLLATHKKKSKTNETLSILSTENGRLEMTKVNIHVKEEDDTKKEHKPGASYVKLKESLQTLIKKKRLEEMQKKQEDDIEYRKCLEGEEDFDEDEDEDDDGDEYEIEGDGHKIEKKKLKLDKIIIDDEENAVSLDEDEDAEDQDDVDGNGDEIEVGEDELADEEESDESEENALIIDECDETDTDSNNSDDYNDEPRENIELKEQMPTTQRKYRILKGFTADSDDDDMDLLKTQPPVVLKNVPNALFTTLDSPIKSSMFLPGLDIDMGINNTQELLGLCSGTFDKTQKPTTSTSDTVLMSQIPMTQKSHLVDATEELLGLCSGTFEGQTEEQRTTQPNIVSSLSQSQLNQNDPEETNKIETCAYKILSTDEEGLTVNNETDARKRIKKLRKKLKRRQVKLGFSDDEDDDDEKAKGGKEGNEDVEDVDMPETYVEYDSEENEIVVEMNKKDRIKHAENFFEKEAELSESEWGSADEDEKQNDDYDIELGDEDEFDRGKLQQELGQIHARKMLDEDIREVRKIQQLFFEDEETDGVGRQRQFRWKNAENGFSLDDPRTGEEGCDPESGDEEQKQEHMWRKIRFEREQLLKEQGLIGSSQEGITPSVSVKSPLTSIIANNNSSNTHTTPILGGSGKKFQIITKKTTLNAAKIQKSSPFLISSSKTSTVGSAAGMTPPTTSLLLPKASRGSFLARDKETLEKFANFTKNKANTGYDEDETAGTVSVKGKNFVFATLTKEEHENLKRKADDLINSGTETGTNFMKKPRPNIDKECRIDKLL